MKFSFEALPGCYIYPVHMSMGQNPRTNFLLRNHIFEVIIEKSKYDNKNSIVMKKRKPVGFWPT